jgi:hypothetical protein
MKWFVTGMLLFLLALLPSRALDHCMWIDTDTLLHESTFLFLNDPGFPLGCFHLTARTRFHSDTGLVRVVLVDSGLHEYLVIESYPLLAGSREIYLEDAAFETNSLPGIHPHKIYVELRNASLDLHQLGFGKYSSGEKGHSTCLMRKQDSLNIEALNRNIRAQGLGWEAGETSLSRMSYAERKAWSGGRHPNLQGFEYYRGGTFRRIGHKTSSLSKSAGNPYKPVGDDGFAREFCWRDRHGRNWMTEVKNQIKSTCWAFGPVGAAEMLVNTYFNQHINYDLSEQNVIACTRGEHRGGGVAGDALSFLQQYGTVPELCFPISEEV